MLLLFTKLLFQNKRAKPLVSAYDDNDKVGIEDDLDFYEDPNAKKKDVKAPGGGFSGGKLGSTVKQVPIAREI